MGDVGAPSRGLVRRALDRRRADDGYTVLEAALVLPVMVFLTMLVIQYALLWHGRHVAEAAAREGLQAASAYRSTPAAGQSAAAEYLHKVAPHLLQRPSVTASGAAGSVTVSVHAVVPSLLGFAQLSVTETATGPVERFAAPRS